MRVHEANHSSVSSATGTSGVVQRDHSMGKVTHQMSPGFPVQSIGPIPRVHERSGAGPNQVNDFLRWWTVPGNIYKGLPIRLPGLLVLTVDGRENPEVFRFLREVRLAKLTIKPTFPKWDLSLVLKAQQLTPSNL